MEGSEAPRLTAVPPPENSEEHLRCDDCGAPVDLAQRYCVVCGAHRRAVRDPAAEYLARATARTRTAASAPAGSRAGRRRGVSLATAAVLAGLPVAVGVGAIAGRDATSGDANLIAALRAQRPQIISGGAAPAAGIPSTRGAARSRTGSKRTSATKPSAVSSTSAAITAAKPTQAQVAQGAAVVAQEQKAAGRSYVNSQQGLPSSVVVP